MSIFKRLKAYFTQTQSNVDELQQSSKKQGQILTSVNK